MGLGRNRAKPWLRVALQLLVSLAVERAGIGLGDLQRADGGVPRAGIRRFILRPLVDPLLYLVSILHYEYLLETPPPPHPNPTPTPLPTPLLHQCFLFGTVLSANRTASASWQTSFGDACKWLSQNKEPQNIITNTCVTEYVCP